MLNLVTITCFRDIDQMILQAKSINTFMQNCKHWVIINENIPDKKMYENNLLPYYKNNQINILYLDSFIHLKNDENVSEYTNAYNRQMCLKFLAYNIVKDDYIILDSKNFFIRSASQDTYEKLEGSGKTMLFDIRNTNKWTDTIVRYTSLLETNFKHLYYTPHTPFKFKKEILKNIENKYTSIDNFVKWFDSVEISYKKFRGGDRSEFLMYSCFCNDIKDNINIYETLWNEDYEIKKIILKMSKVRHYKIPVFGIHRYFLQKARQDKIVLNVINNFLALSKIDYFFINY